ncbi:MAG: hypothetical protein Ta2A_09940 [Treponemataceae bacterium]|nr:MAG: hypothetical protein Ta2A_09940 [Treponemataceae bacterium]
MKKITVGFLLFFLSSICFVNANSFDFGAGYHTINKTIRVQYQDISGHEPTFAVNFAFTLGGGSGKWKTLAVGMYFSLLFPQLFEFSAEGQSTAIDKSDYEAIFGMDFLGGVTFRLYTSKKFHLPLTIGIHWYAMVTKNNYFRERYRDVVSYSSLGVGANIGGEYNFTSKFYTYARVQLSYDPFTEVSKSSRKATHSAAKSSGILLVSTVSIEPCLGVGFRW